ncbi:ATP-binding cassette domain-containing protein [Helicobacter saguini]|uniref:ABC transporter ATP-binding protein n=1 Tax=Helicobacter saguini TaxID=1548018 RepID=A0A347W432_9HELI|nr:ABC transporter ATP-binding protein [Helicobacter saguini]MWV62005.1 ATP-binding cassette domain-containing protein [Helicobacter saguini]MWV67320.1 ATP-binding cassette domain-containing protein [Helicobacter saguini]MWV69673.1 ATP-binding cassette domain-containing protein [Helicobacter saguini]MWV73110.1 ATP-binding cassette domain-containing protein [Helicobacter saguini]TLD95523.1 ABC transporter ATP-binding protein [Helicobacter saguini]
MQNISIKNLTKSYDKARILRGISLDINAGDFVTLLGSSGCGKTTLLNILGGFSSFDSGEISIDSKVYTHTLNLSPTRIKVFQNYVLLPWKNALNQVIFALKSSLAAANIKKSKGEIKDIALNYLELVGLKEHIYKFPHELSGGQQSRVSIARALSVEPEVLLMDEPFGALDSFTRENLQNELKLIVQRLKTTCIFVTHDVIESMILGSKIVVMNNIEGNIALQITQNREYNKQDSYFNNLQEEIYEALKYPQTTTQEKYVI